MGRGSVVAVGLLIVSLAAGCKSPTRMAAKVTEVPRVDIASTGGNRGFLTGTAPASADRKTTRQMFETTIEIPSRYKPTPGVGGAPMPEDQAPEAGMAGPVTDEPMVDAPPAVAGPFDTYAVQKGDSLWSIAAKPEVYGKASQWRKIFDANRDLLKTPDQVRQGMTLKIPRGEAADDSTTYDDDEGISFKK